MIIKGKITPKQRVRFSNHIYTPTKTKQMEELIRMAYKTQDKVHYGSAPIKVEIIYTKKNPMTTPDLDNIIKLLDALNGIAYDDDKQIVEIIARKEKGEESLEIKVEIK
jgi:Holliday junction resolvase RusA-like endonuclease